MFLLQFRQFARHWLEFIQFVELEAQQVGAVLQFLGVIAEVVEVGQFLLPGAVAFRHGAGLIVEAGVFIQQLAVSVFLQQGLMLVLAVDTHQHFPQLLQCLHR